MEVKSPTVSRQEGIARMVVLIALCSVPALMCIHQSFVGDPDIWWHLRSAEWILQHHAIPRTDPFSSVEAGKPWAAYSWLFQLIVFKLYVRWNLVGIMAYTVTMLVAITTAFYRLARRMQPDFTKAVLLTMAAMGCMSRLYTPRPWLFTILFFVLELDILLQVRRTGRARYLFFLPLIFAVWANVHIQFINGLLVLGIAAVEASAARWWPSSPRIHPGKLWGALAACLAATLINPYGVKIYQVAYQLASQPGVLNKLSELQAVPFRGFGDYVLLFLAITAGAVLAWKRHFPLFEVLLLIVAATLSFRSQRDVWILAIAACAILAEQLPANLKAQSTDSPLTPAFAMMGAAVVALVGGVCMHANNARFHDLLVKMMPVKAVEFAKDKGFSGPLYNDYNWGGYLIWNLRQPVSIDGRANLYGDERIDRSDETWSGTPDWKTDPQLKAAGLVIAPRKAPLTQLLRNDQHFRLAFEDDVAAVFVSNSSQSKDVAAKSAAAPLSGGGM